MWLKQYNYKLFRLILYAAIFALIYFLFLFFDCTKIIKIHSFSQARHILQNADKSALVIFDVDDTLIVPESKILWPRIYEQNQKWIDQFFDESKKNTSPELEKYYGALQMLKEKPVLIEPEIVNIIKELQEDGVKVIALTATDTGEFSIIPSLAEWRFKVLKELGLDFSKINILPIEFNELPLGAVGNSPVFYNGILFSSTAAKGGALGAFLDRIKWKPSKIIFFDDNIKHLKSVAEEMNKRSIPFYGYQYSGSEYMTGELDKELVVLQHNHLIKHNEWLTEDEARTMLKKTHI